MAAGGLLDQRIDWRWVMRRLGIIVGIAALVAVNALLVAGVILRGTPADYGTLQAVVHADSPFDVAAWRWSPIAAWLTPIIAGIGLVAWRILHVLALLLLPSWPLRIVVGLSFPFWWDVMAGNVMTFVLVAAYWAIRGHTLGIAATLLLALLIPRPLMLPLVAWVLWRHPLWRWRFAAMALGSVVLVLFSGHAGAWFERLLSSSGEMEHFANWGPTAIIGPAWLILAVPLSALALWRGSPATAGLLLQPYWFPYYLMLPLADSRHASA